MRKGSDVNSTHNESSTTRRLSKGMFGIALITGFMTCFGVVAAIGAIGADEQEPEPHTGGPVTERIVVASGELPRTGTWKLYHSQDAKGQDCFEWGVLIGPADQRGEVQYGGCGVPEGLGVGTLTAEFGDYTVIRGHAPENVSEIRLEGDGMETVAVSNLSEARSSGKNVFAIEVPGKPKNITAVGLDSNGERVASQRVPTPSGEGGH
jgi:hypothetical protein